MIKIASSILTADFSRLGDEIKTLESSDYIHFDVMDGVFVPNISIGLPVLESVRKITDKTLDVHLMVTSPARYATRFAQAGGDIIVFHVEAEQSSNIPPAIHAIRVMGKKAGLSIRPGTPVEAVLPYIAMLDVVLVMTVEPGFGGQGLIYETLPKISELRRVIDSQGLPCDIEVDGGINHETAPLCIRAGATVLVAGSAVIKSGCRAASIDELRGAG